jgi:hypothetical protein
MELSNISKYADMLAIPNFALLVYYFLSIKRQKTIIEYLLLIFAISGLILDIVFTIQFINSK